MSRHAGSVARSSTPAPRAVRFTGTPWTPTPDWRGERTAAPGQRRDRLPHGQRRQAEDRHRDAREEPAPRRPVVLAVGLLTDRAPQRGRDRRKLHRDVDDDRPHEHPGDGEVHPHEGERPRVPLEDVEEPGDQLEDRGGDEDGHRPPLEQVQRSAQPWTLEQCRVGGVQLGQQQRQRGQTRSDVQALAQPEPPDRQRRERDPGDGMLVQVGQQPRDERRADRRGQQDADPGHDARVVHRGPEVRLVRRLPPEVAQPGAGHASTLGRPSSVGPGPAMTAT